MPSVSKKHPNERFDSLFRRFKKVVDNAETLKEVRARSHFESQSERRKRAKAAAKKRWQKKLESTTLNRKRLY